MNETGTVKVILPAYNEESAIGDLLNALSNVATRNHLSLFPIVVDDGSQDRTAEFSQQFSPALPVRLLRHPENRGLPAALRTGFGEALKACGEEDILITMDADNTHPTDLIPTMVQKIREGNDIVIASRYTGASSVKGLSPLRQLMSDGTSWLFRILFPIKGVKDFTCGYRAYRAGLLMKGFNAYGSSFINQPGFSCMADLLIKLRRFHPVMTEVPFVLRYDLKKGKSKMKVWKTVAETMILIVKRKLGINR